MPTSDTLLFYAAFLYHVYGFYSRGIIVMVLRGGLIHLGHHWRLMCEMDGPPLALNDGSGNLNVKMGEISMHN